MKTVSQELKSFLIENGYGEEESVIYASIYQSLPDAIKSQYKEMPDGKYCRVAKIPDISGEELQRTIELENDRKLRRMEEHLNIIKYCTLVLAGATILSVIASIISIINLMNL